MRTRSKLVPSLSPARLLVIAAVVVGTALPAFAARACWDGHRATVGNVTLSSGDTDWSPARARELATWLARIDALLPSGTTLEAEHGYVSLCSADEDRACTEWQWDQGSLATLFVDVAARSGASAEVVRAARSVQRAVLVVQIASFTDRARAESLERSVSESGIGEPGFYEAGGFPAMNPVAHVISTGQGGERPVHRVIVGTFVDREQAERVREGLATELGVDAIVRPL